MSKSQAVKGIEPIDITEKEIAELLCRMESKKLMDSDFILLNHFVNAYSWFYRLLEKKDLSIKKLKRLFFIKTEKTENIVKADVAQAFETPPVETESKEEEKKPPTPPKKGHGKNKVSDYGGAEQQEVPHPEVSPGDICPDCQRGKLYRFKWSNVVRIISQPPLSGKVYSLETLRCASCSKIYKAPLPAEAGKEKYSEGTGAMIAYLKYGNGFPFNRLENFQKNMDIPIAASTLWDIMEKTADRIYPVYFELLRMAAQGEVIHNDDTTVRILSQIKEKKAGKTCKGTFTTGIVAKAGKQLIILYFSGENHAGENLTELLKNRQRSLGPPIQMCDGLSRNLSRDFKTILVNCLTHGRRKFVDLYDWYQTECQFVIESIRDIYHYEELAQKMQMSPAQRLHFHQQKSKPVMDHLKIWMDQQIDGNIVEPNCSLGKAINYMRKRWHLLTGFLHIENAPIDNNITERALKKAILNRKNSYFFKTQFGAEVGDIFISLIQTCIQAKVNAYEYLTVLQKNAVGVFTEPQNWLPWNYKQTLASENLK